MKVAGVAHVIPETMTFVTPVFTDEQGDGTLFAQFVEGGRVRNFEAISVGEEFVPLASQKTISIGDEALYGFQFSETAYALASREALIRSISKRLKLDSHFEASLSASTRAAIRRFTLDGIGSLRSNPPLLTHAIHREQSLTALIVDDSRAFRTYTCQVLQNAGLIVRTASDGLEALDVLKSCRPDVILMDIEMPRMDGYLCAMAIRSQAELASIPILVVSSLKAEKHYARAAELGIASFVNKPYKGDELLEAIESAVPETCLEGVRGSLALRFVGGDERH